MDRLKLASGRAASRFVGGPREVTNDTIEALNDSPGTNITRIRINNCTCTGNCRPIGLPFKHRTLSFQKISSSLTEGGKGNLESQLDWRTMNICKKFVVRVTAWPTTRLKELILPAMAQSFLAEEQLASNIELISDNTRWIFFPRMKRKSWKKWIVKPSQSITRVGTQIDFSDLTLVLWSKVTWYEGASPKAS